MRKENCLWSLLAIIMVAMLSLSLVSCGDDDDKSSSSSVSGLYYYGDSSTRTAYNFVNGNTVEMYGAMSSDPNAKWRGESGVAFPLEVDGITGLETNMFTAMQSLATKLS